MKVPAPARIVLPLVLIVTTMRPVSLLADPGQLELANAVCATAAAQPGSRRVLTMHAAERAIDLAFEAELAGDFKGGREALEQLIATSTQSVETAGRERLKSWLGTMKTRESAQNAGPPGRAHAVAHETLREYGLRRSSRLWARALEKVPGLRAAATASTTVRLRFDRIDEDLDRGTLLRELADLLTRNGLHPVVGERAPASYEARLDAQSAASGDGQHGGARVTADVSVLLREVHEVGGGRSIASTQKHRTEARRTGAEARKIATRRALEDAGEMLVFLLRQHQLENAAAREAARVER